MSIDRWFPTCILGDKLNSFKPLLSDYVLRAYDIEKTYPSSNDWNCNTYSSIDQVDLTKDILFEPIIKDCAYKILEFAAFFGVQTKKVNCQSAWINIAKPGSYQEYHIHPGSHFSVVVYLKTPKDCGNIVFRNPSANSDMFPLPVGSSIESNHATCFYVPEELKFLGFRSNLLHMVEVNKSKEDRISLAINFTV